MSLYTNKSFLEQSSPLHNKIYDIINPINLKKEREKNLKFPQEWFTDETQLLWLKMSLFSKKALHNIESIHNSDKTYGILLK